MNNKETCLELKDRKCGDKFVNVNFTNRSMYEKVTCLG